MFLIYSGVEALKISEGVNPGTAVVRLMFVGSPLVLMTLVISDLPYTQPLFITLPEACYLP